jgi:hypothetical protein
MLSMLSVHALDSMSTDFESVSQKFYGPPTRSFDFHPVIGFFW